MEKNKMTGIELIAAERQRQMEVEGWTPDHDDEHGDFQMIDAAMCYACRATHDISSEYAALPSKPFPPDAWPWDGNWWKPSDDPVRNLVKAGALIAAEIDRIQRQSNAGGE
jgi:hypothetical protein